MTMGSQCGKWCAWQCERSHEGLETFSNKSLSGDLNGQTKYGPSEHNINVFLFNIRAGQINHIGCMYMIVFIAQKITLFTTP